MLRRHLEGWGATAAESSGRLPGDEIVDDPNHESTRAVEINADPAAVWPWLVQMGQGRGGLYSYEWLQNLFRLDMHNSERILPEFQNVAVGDTIRLAPSGAGPRVRELATERHMVLEDTGPAWTWAFVLRPVEPGRTRLVARNRVATRNESVPVQLLYVALAPAVFVMERKMLLGIKHRAELLHAHGRQRAVASPA